MIWNPLPKATQTRPQKDKSPRRARGFCRASLFTVMIRTDPDPAAPLERPSRLHLYSRLVAACTLFLVFAGGMVTSTGSGLAVPDWPLSYGMLMPPMIGGIFYEHGHRMVATLVGMLTIGLAIWLHRTEKRRWLRHLGWAALGGVCLQGLLGGITVLYFLPTAISVSHAGLAELFFATTVCIAIFTSPGWKRRVVYREQPQALGLATLTTIAAATVYSQILAGALMRHTGAGLAIPDFPLVFGGIIPPEFTAAIATHYVHRVGALVVTIIVFWVLGRAWQYHRDQPEIMRPALLLGFLLVVQIGLGGYTILSEKLPVPTSLHVVTGAAMWGTSVLLALRARRHLSASGQTEVGSMGMSEVTA